jgi:hypothetical protein
MAITRWIFNYGLANQYNFTRNPDRAGGDSFWNFNMRSNEVAVIGSSTPIFHVDGYDGGRRTLKFTAITGDMLRTLQQFYLAGQVLTNCRDHLYPTTLSFSCLIVSFTPAIHPSYGTFPGSNEDTWDLEMVLVAMGPTR